MENQEVSIIDVKKKAALYGVVLGVISFVLGIVSLLILKNATGLITATVVSSGLNLVGSIVISCFFVIVLRKAIGGYWDFGVALRNIFIMLAVSGVLSTVGTSLLNASYPTLQEEAIDNMMNITIESLEAMGTPDEQIDSTIEALEQQKESLGTISIGQVIKGIAIALVLYFVFALILAAIFKKEKPIFPEHYGNQGEAHPWSNDGNQPFPNS